MPDPNLCAAFRIVRWFCSNELYDPSKEGIMLCLFLPLTASTLTASISPIPGWCSSLRCFLDTPPCSMIFPVTFPPFQPCFWGPPEASRCGRRGSCGARHLPGAPRGPLRFPLRLQQRGAAGGGGALARREPAQQRRQRERPGRGLAGDEDAQRPAAEEEGEK